MANLLIDANAQPPPPARGQAPASATPTSPPSRPWYRGAVAKGIADNQGKRTQIAKDGLRLARRFRDHEDMILRFATDLTVGFASRHQRTRHPPGQGPAAHLRRDLAHPAGLADFAIVQSYLSTAVKWGIDALDALARLFTDGPWLPPATAHPTGPAERTSDDSR